MKTITAVGPVPLFTATPKKEIPPVASSTPPEKRDFWQRIMQDYEKSGLSQKAFCQSRSIAPSQFRYYRYRLFKQSSPQKALLPIQVIPEKKKPQKNTEPFTLHLSSGPTLLIPQSYHTAALKALLAVLEA